MKREDELELTGYLHRALEAKYGLKLTFIDGDAMKLYRTKLYAVRRQYPEFQSLTFTDQGKEMWIVKRIEDDGQEI